MFMRNQRQEIFLRISFLESTQEFCDKLRRVIQGQTSPIRFGSNIKRLTENSAGLTFKLSKL